MDQPDAPEGTIPEWDLADRMKKALRHAGIGVQEMADYLGVARNTISTWTSGRITPSLQTLRLWALRCGVNYDWLRAGPSAVARPGPDFRTAQTRAPFRVAA